MYNPTIVSGVLGAIGDGLIPSGAPHAPDYEIESVETVVASNGVVYFRAFIKYPGETEAVPVEFNFVPDGTQYQEYQVEEAVSFLVANPPRKRVELLREYMAKRHEGHGFRFSEREFRCFDCDVVYSTGETQVLMMPPGGKGGRATVVRTPMDGDLNWGVPPYTLSVESGGPYSLVKRWTALVASSGRSLASGIEYTEGDVSPEDVAEQVWLWAMGLLF